MSRTDHHYVELFRKRHPSILRARAAGTEEFVAMWIAQHRRFRGKSDNLKVAFILRAHS
jgi:hypothetical protein